MSPGPDNVERETSGPDAGAFEVVIPGGGVLAPYLDQRDRSAEYRRDHAS